MRAFISARGTRDLRNTLHNRYERFVFQEALAPDLSS